MRRHLYIVRHGIAEPKGGIADADRRLTEVGVRRFRRAALGLKRLGIVPDVILSSPLIRAEQTAQLLVAVLAPELAVEIYPPLAPGNQISEVLAGLRAYRRARHIMLVGHQPDLGELASHLLTGSASVVSLPFKKGGVAAIEVTALPPHNAGNLEWFMAPRQLRAIARGGR